MGHKNDKDKAAREQWVYARAAKESEPVDRIELVFDPITGEMHIPQMDPSSYRHVTSYPKENGGDKTLFVSPADSFTLPDKDYLELLAGRFDYLIAVDTNSMKAGHRIRGVRISACASYAFAEPLSTVVFPVKIHPVAIHVILDPGPTVNPELLGWHLIIERLRAIHTLSSKRIGIIVDSELGLHADFNTRKKPYYADNFLPLNMQLLYASDKPLMFANAMIKQCHKAADVVLKEYMARDPRMLDTYRGNKYGEAITFPYQIPLPPRS